MMHPRACRISSFLSFLFLAGLLAGCGGGRDTPTSSPQNRAVPIGTWGGNGIAVTVNTGGATVEFDCAHGTIDHPMTTDSAGRFSLSGTYVQEHGGPIGPEPPDRHPAIYDGSVSGNVMTVTITLTDTNRAVGSFTAAEGASPRIVKCL
jgi:hypothetical protein